MSGSGQVVPDTSDETPRTPVGSQDADPPVVVPAVVEPPAKVDPPAQKPQTPLPWRELSVVLVIVISEGFASTFLLPFIAYMVIGFGIAPTSVGYYAGFVTSAFFVSQLFSSLILGYVSDLKGRRPIMLLGLLGNCITSISFGLSTNLAVAIISRLLCGLINGNAGVVRSYLREITDETNQARAYSIRSAGLAAGMILGPFVGGVLARPAINFPGYFASDGLFGRYPFLLPCLVSAALNGVGVVLGYFYIKETVKSKPPPTEASPAPPSPSPSPARLENASNSEKINTSGDDAEVPLEILEEGSPTAPKPKPVSVHEMTLWEGLAVTGRQFLEALKTQAVLVTMILYAVLAAVWICFDEVFAVWSLQSIETGGLYFREANIGIAHAISSIGMFVFQLFIFPSLDKAVGSRRAFQLTCAILGPIAILIPFTNVIASTSNTALLWICIGTLMATKSATGAGASSAINLMINNASDPELVGSVNGLSTSIAALARLIAPTVGGSTYAWSINNGLPFPLDFHFVFLLMGIICVSLSVVAEKYLDSSIDVRKKKS